jgi:hypothetical protein
MSLRHGVRVITDAHRGGPPSWTPRPLVRFAPAASTPDGYGRVEQQPLPPTPTAGSPPSGKHRDVLAHRLAYELVHGAVPAGLELDHLCRVRSCTAVDPPRGCHARREHAPRGRGSHALPERPRVRRRRPGRLPAPERPHPPPVPHLQARACDRRANAVRYAKICPGACGPGRGRLTPRKESWNDRLTVPMHGHHRVVLTRERDRARPGTDRLPGRRGADQRPPLADSLRKVHSDVLVRLLARSPPSTPTPPPSTGRRLSLDRRRIILANGGSRSWSTPPRCTWSPSDPSSPAARSRSARSTGSTSP